ncbi:MAG: peptide chain release factor N(5)-glutamine methyltransferase, partial [Candidatus Aminicenantales bacterium]
MSTIQELFQKGSTLLKSSVQPAVETKLLLLKCTGLSEEKLLAWPERKVTKKEEKHFLKLLAKRQEGIPLSYLIGQKEFWSMSLVVKPGVFIPRPETELIVEKVLELDQAGGPNNEKIVVDIGTGCGNIALALAKERPWYRIIGTDISLKSIKAAKFNAQHLGLKNVEFIRGSLFKPLAGLGLEGKCDFIVSNPPYVTEVEWQRMPPEIKIYEPKKALVAGRRGLEFIEKLVAGVRRFLKPGGWLLLEIGQGQKEAVLSLFREGWDETDSCS